MDAIERTNISQLSLAITASSSTTATINKSGFVTGTIFVPAGSSLTGLTFFVAPHESMDGNSAGTFVQAYDDSNAALALTVAAGRAYRIPLELAAAPFLRIVGDATGTIHVSLQG